MSRRQSADGGFLQELGTDMGTDFLNVVVEAYGIRNRVLHGRSTGYSTGYSLGASAVERAWRVLLAETSTRMRAALKECGLPGGYWWDAMRHCIGSMTLSPHSNVSRTPFEVFMGKAEGEERAHPRRFPCFPCEMGSWATKLSIRCTSADIRIHQHTSAYINIHQHTSAYISIHQHTSTCDVPGPLCGSRCGPVLS